MPRAISGPQIRAARGFLAWTVRDLANKAVVAIAVVQKIESGELAASLVELVAIQSTLAAEGIEFTNHDGVPGVRLHHRKPPAKATGQDS
jgi:predicted transcriptional regulator